MCEWAYSLEDTHVWELAKRITSEKKLRDLGLNILRLPRYLIDSALNNNKTIELAAYETLETWREKQENLPCTQVFGTTNGNS